MTVYPTDPPLECDLVMKGGITSGVIYPRAVCELAKTYRLRAVGGASAGAIGAAAAAAAELGRRTGAGTGARPGGFPELERMPDDITAPSPAGGSTLLRLFQPTPMAAPLFGVLTAAMPQGERKDEQRPADAERAEADTGRVRRILLAVLRWFWLALLVGALPGIVLAVLAGMAGGGAGRWAGVLAAVVLAVIGAVLALALSAVRLVGQLTGWGLCTGMSGVGGNGAPALTPWLHERIQTMAGRGPGDHPVTFGDLAKAGVTLRMMTTNVTRYQPMTMPWASREYFLNADVMKEYFPADVVEWLTEKWRTKQEEASRLEQAQPTEHEEALSAEQEEERRYEDRWSAVLEACARERGLYRMPPPREVPIIVATRMSLSFPVLISAVPLMAVDYSRQANRTFRDDAEAWLRKHKDADPAEALTHLSARPEFAPNWFSDGGLCANLPVHFFDCPLPTRPTFAINLGRLPKGRQPDPDPAKNIYLPTSNKGGVLRRWHALEPNGVGGMFRFLHALVETARTWVDEAQLRLPGYRDRVVLIKHSEDEGGMNLAMPKPVVDSLAKRGQAAGKRLVEVFAGPEPGRVPAWGFENHRWIRFRTAGAGLERWLAGWENGYTTPVDGATPYPDLAGPGASATPPSYKPKSKEQRNAMNTVTGQVFELAQTWPEGTMVKGTPHPVPRLRLVPEEGVAEIEVASDAPQSAPTMAASDVSWSGVWDEPGL